MIAIKRGIDFDLSDVVRRCADKTLPDAEGILRHCMFRSVEVRYGLIDGKVACIWGLIPPTVLSSQAWLWLTTTDIVAEHKFLFVRYSQIYVEEALKRYSEIVGDVLVNNRSGQRWLKWLGAEFGPAVGGRIPFSIKAKNEPSTGSGR